MIIFLEFRSPSFVPMNFDDAAVEVFGTSSGPSRGSYAFNGRDEKRAQVGQGQCVVGIRGGRRRVTHGGWTKEISTPASTHKTTHGTMHSIYVLLHTYTRTHHHKYEKNKGICTRNPSSFSTLVMSINVSECPALYRVRFRPEGHLFAIFLTSPSFSPSKYGDSFSSSLHTSLCGSDGCFQAVAWHVWEQYGMHLHRAQ